MSGMIKPLKTFEDVEAMLRHWVSFADPQLYDAGGMVLLFAACLENMRLRMLEAEMEDIDSYLPDEQNEFLLKLATMVRRAQSSG